MNPAQTIEDVVAEVRSALGSYPEPVNVAAATGALRTFLESRASNLDVPGFAELSGFLEARTQRVGTPNARAEFHALAIAAAEYWGTEETAHFSRVLRDSKVTVKKKTQTEWDRAETALDRLPPTWRDKFRQKIRHWRGASFRDRGAIDWSANHTISVASALARWRAHCAAQGISTTPTGITLDTYARSIANQDQAGTRSAADYVGRILTGFQSILDPEFASPACDFVVRDWRERAALEGSPTKSGRQLVGARAIYDLGFQLISEAKGARVRGFTAALKYRDGLLLAIAAALPKRARVMSVLEFDRTIFLLPNGKIRVWIPGHAMKLPEREKDRKSWEKTFTNGRLWQALADFRRGFRPLFDDGAMLFPSKIAPRQGISESRISKIVGNHTEKHFGVRVSIHRVRDNVATDACEHLPNGGFIAPALLDHKDASTTQKHYDHSEGVSAATEFEVFLDTKRSGAPDLLL